MGCSTNRSAKRSATTAQGSTPKNAENARGHHTNRHTRLSIQVTTHAVLRTPSRKPSPRSSRISYTCYANAPHVPSHTSPYKCTTQTRHTLAAAQTHHTHCYACHRTHSPSRTLAVTHARRRTSPLHKPVTQSANSPHATKSHTKSHTANHKPNHKPNRKRHSPANSLKNPHPPPFLVAHSRLPDRNTKNSTTSACL